MMILPPSPPSPPSGPPRGMYFSRRKLMQPSPPRPAVTSMVTRSTNMAVRDDEPGVGERDQTKTGMPGGIPDEQFYACNSDLVFRWDDVHAAAFAVKLHFAIDEREQRVVAALPDALAGVELRPQLADDDVPGDDLLAAVTLHAAALAVRITTVAAGALTFFMCHGMYLTQLNRRRTKTYRGEK